MQDIEHLGQLGAYLEAGKGSVPGQYWTLEIAEADDGVEMEIGIRGIYRKNIDAESNEQLIVFESTSENYPMPPYRCY